MEENNKATMPKSEKIAFIVCMILALIGLAATVVWFDNKNCTGPALIGGIVSTIVHLGVFYYGLIGYKEPHGNTLRYIILLFGLGYGALMMANVITSVGNLVLGFLGIFVTGASCYMAGRLDRVNKNRAIVIFLDVLILASSIYSAIDLSGMWELTGFAMVVYVIFCFSPLFCWQALVVSYFGRYKMHRAAAAKENQENE